MRWCVVVAIVWAAAVGRGESPASVSRAEEAAKRGRAWLVAAQAADGSWGSGLFRESVAVTAQSVMALVAGGSTPTTGEHA